MRTLLVHSGELAELLDALPALKELKRRMPAAYVELVVQKRFIPVLSRLRFWDRLRNLDEHIVVLGCVHQVFGPSQAQPGHFA